MTTDQKEEVLSAFFRLVADGEAAAETARRRLGESWEFFPWEVFTSLRGLRSAQKDCVLADDIHVWLTQQRFCTEAFDVKDVELALRGAADLHGELSYQGFLRLVLPTNPNDERLRETILRRGNQSPPVSVDYSSQIPVEVAWRLGDLLQHEMKLSRQLIIHGEKLKELHVSTLMIDTFFAEQMEAMWHGQREAVLRRAELVRDDLARWWPKARTSMTTQSPRASQPSVTLFSPLAPRTSVVTMSPRASQTSVTLRSPRASPRASRTSVTLRSPRTSRASVPTVSPLASAAVLSPCASRTSIGTSPRGSTSLGSPRASPMCIAALSLRLSPHKNASPLPRSSRSPVAMYRVDSPLSVGSRGRSVSSSRSGSTFSRRSTLERDSTPCGKEAESTERKVSWSPRSGSTRAPSTELTSPRLLDSPADTSLLRSAPPVALPGPSVCLPRMSVLPARPSVFLATPSVNVPRPSVFSVRPSLCPTGASPTDDNAKGDTEPNCISTSPKASSAFLSTPSSPSASVPRRSVSPADTRSMSPCAARVKLPTSGRRDGTVLEVQAQERRMYDTNCVLQLMRHQAELDVRVEDAKGMISTDVSLEDLFHELDSTHKGFIEDTDLWRFVQGLGTRTLLGSVTALIREIQMRLASDRLVTPGELSMRELAILIFPAGSMEYDLARNALSDDDLLCKLRRRQENRPVPLRLRYEFAHLIDVAASAADQLDADRRQLNMLRCDSMSALNDTFGYIAAGLQSFSVVDLRRAFLHEYIVATSMEAEALWRRYQPLPFETGVRFSDFVRQLGPRSIV